MGNGVLLPLPLPMQLSDRPHLGWPRRSSGGHSAHLARPRSTLAAYGDFVVVKEDLSNEASGSESFALSAPLVVPAAVEEMSSIAAAAAAFDARQAHLVADRIGY